MTAEGPDSTPEVTPDVTVAVVPQHTIEAACLTRLCTQAGMRCSDADDPDLSLLIFALPRGRVLARDVVDLAGRARGHVLVVAPPDDPMAHALAQVLHADATVNWSLTSASMVATIRATAVGRTVPAGPVSSMPPADPLSTLTQRERHVLDLVADGCTDDQIARRLEISGHTVRTHLQRAMAKLGVPHRHAAAAAVRADRPLNGARLAVPVQRRGSEAS